MITREQLIEAIFEAMTIDMEKAADGKFAAKGRAYDRKPDPKRPPRPVNTGPSSSKRDMVATQARKTFAKAKRIKLRGRHAAAAAGVVAVGAGGAEWARRRRNTKRKAVRRRRK